MAQKFSKQFYSCKAWRDLSFLCRTESGGKCSKCNNIFADISKLKAHHKMELTPDNINDSNISLNKSNIEVLCTDCHNREHYRFTSDKQNVYIVWGSPLSGKNTYVKEVMNYGDMIIDIDSIYKCISGLPIYNKPNTLKYNVFKIRDLLYDMVYTRYGHWHDCYIVGGFANEIERNQLAERLGGELIYIESTKRECIERAAQRPVEWIQYVEDWWREYELNSG